MPQTRELRPAAEVDPTFQMFASRSVAVHVVRGVLGLVALVVGLTMASSSGWWLLLLVATPVLWRGCPTCWVMGLIATRGRRAPATG